MAPSDPDDPDPRRPPTVARRRLLTSAAVLVGGAGAGAVLPTSPAAAGSAPAPEAGRGGVVDVTDHGAVGDGVTVDTAAIQAAVDEAAARGGIVRFPPGHYRLGAPGIRITRPVQLAGVGWEGTAVEEGAGEKAPVPGGSWLFVDDPITAAVTVEAAPAANPPSGVIVRDLAFRQTQPAGSGVFPEPVAQAGFVPTDS